MLALSRKQREILQREQLILDATAEILQQEGYLGLSMERIAEAIEYSKGTIYQHFPCKEEVLCALLIRSHTILSNMFQRASHFQGTPRERMAAVLTGYQIFVKLYQREFSNLLIIKNVSIRDKISPASQTRLLSEESACLEILTKIVDAAIQSGDLVLTNTSPTELVYGFWSIAFGSAILQSTDCPLDELGIHQPDHVIRRHCRYLLDCYAWKPLSQDWDYEASYKRISTELFADEVRQLQTMECQKDFSNIKEGKS